jgi:hypothetical protein
VGAALVVLAVSVSGCISLKTNTATQATPGKVTVKAVVCASKYARGGSPDWTDCQPSTKLFAPDNHRQDATTAADGRLLVGFRVPAGTEGPASFASKHTEGTFEKSPSYTAELRRVFPPSPSQQWIGYMSTVGHYAPTTKTRSIEFQVDFTLPKAANGAAFSGPFRWREVVGFRSGNAGEPVSCPGSVNGNNCFDSPPPATARTDVSSPVSDFGVRAATTPTAYAGTTAVVPFFLSYSDGARIGRSSFSLKAATNLPQTSAVAAPAKIDMAPDSTTVVTARVAVPASAAAGQYAVGLSAASGASNVTHADVGSIVVKPVLNASPNNAVMEALWTATRSGFTIVRSLVVRYVPAGGAVTVRCRGRGCPLKSKTTNKRGRITLTRLFRHHRLRRGATIEVRVAEPSHIGKVFSFRMRARKLPTTKVRCVPPATKKALPCG